MHRISGVQLARGLRTQSFHIFVRHTAIEVKVVKASMVLNRNIASTTLSPLPVVVHVEPEVIARGKVHAQLLNLSQAELDLNSQP